MKKLKKALKMLALVSLIILASLGIGMAGGIPIPFSDKRREKQDVNIELVETAEEDEEMKNFESIN